MRGLFIKKIIAFAIILTCIIIYGQISMNKVQQSIAGKILRFHVRANSDSTEDQMLKLKVKDAIIDYLREHAMDTYSLKATRDFLDTHNDEIVAIAKEIVEQEGYDYEVRAYFDECYFPLKTYGDMSFPPGIYNAFRIDIGKANGKNWWCVLYPKLCFVDGTYAYVPKESKEEFKNIFTEEEYRAVTDDVRFDWKMKYIFSK